MEPIGVEETEAMRSVLEQIFGTQARSWMVTYATYEALGKLIAENKQCTKALSLVPRPYSFFSPFKWAQKQVRQTLIAFFQSAEGKSCLVYMRSSGLKMRMKFEKSRFAAY